MSNRFWVYENIPNNKALVHLSSCSHCNDGQGRETQDKADNGEWFGPYTKSEALGHAKRSEKVTRRWCGFCAKKMGVNPENLEA